MEGLKSWILHNLSPNRIGQVGRNHLPWNSRNDHDVRPPSTNNLRLTPSRSAARRCGKRRDAEMQPRFDAGWEPQSNGGFPGSCQIVWLLLRFQTCKFPHISFCWIYDIGLKHIEYCLVSIFQDMCVFSDALQWPQENFITSSINSTIVRSNPSSLRVAAAGHGPQQQIEAVSKVVLQVVATQTNLSLGWPLKTSWPVFDWMGPHKNVFWSNICKRLRFSTTHSCLVWSNPTHSSLTSTWDRSPSSHPQQNWFRKLGILAKRFEMRSTTNK